MVWFQCEDCGENLKKPKLPNHFRICSSNKFSCIDCGVTFGQQSVQGHNQCITEAEKYGPKGQGKASNGTSPKVKGDTKQKPDIDINVGLSEHPPWFCSLCNTKATSQQALLLHAEGKKHRAKARSFHAANQQSKQTEESTPNTNICTENGHKGGLPDNKDERESQEQDSPKVVLVKNSSEAENGIVSSNKKRKIDTSEEDGARKKAGHITSGEVVNGDVIQMDRAAGEEKKVQGQEADHNTPKENEVVEVSSAKENTKKKIKWKKMITSALKSNPDGVLKMRKLRKLVLESIQEYGSTEDEDQLRDMLEQKINSSSRFEVDNKYVRLVAQN